MAGKTQRRVAVRFFGACLSLLLLSIGITACAEKNVQNQSDIFTQKETEKGRTQISVLVKYAFTINEFEKAVEEKFPDIDLVQVGNYTSDMGVSEYESRMEHDDLTDIVMTWPLNVGEEYWEDRLLDLSGMEFTGRYNLSMLNGISKEGKLYYLPGPSQIRGIVYNKTLFEEKGWQVPDSYEGFLELCQTIEESGMRSIQLGFGNGEVLDTAFFGYGLGTCFGNLQDDKNLQNYDAGEGSFEDNFGPALDIFQEMIDAGIWKQEDLNITYADREKMLFNRECAMAEDSVLLAKLGYTQTGTKDEFALMPFLTKGSESDWARLYMVCYIGLNKHLAEKQNADKYDLVLKLMDYISTPEGQVALAADTGGMYSSLAESGSPDVPEIKDMMSTLDEGRCAIFPTLQNAQPALRQGLAGMISGKKTREDVVKMVDEQNRNPIKAAEPVKLGEASEDFTMIETGSYWTDVLQKAGECQLALFLDNGKDGMYNGKGISGKFYKGEITTEDTHRIYPDLKYGETGTLWKVSMTGENLQNTLEYAITTGNDSKGWFYYFSGLKMEFNPTAEPGKRIRKISLADGKPLEKDEVYSIAVMDHSVPEEYLESCEETDLRITDLVEKDIREKKTISPAKDERFKIVKD